jgi:hypothetical protein
MLILFGIGLFLMMLFMSAMDKRFGDFMGMVFVLGMIGLAIVAVVCIAGAFIIPILFAIAVPIFLLWFVFWILTGIFKSPEQILAEKNANRVYTTAQELLTWRTDARHATKLSQDATIELQPRAARAFPMKRTHASYAKKPSVKKRPKATSLIMFAIILFLIIATIIHNFHQQ